MWMLYLLAYMYAYAYIKIKKIQLRIMNKRKFHRAEPFFGRNWSLIIFSIFCAASVFITAYKKQSANGIFSKVEDCSPHPQASFLQCTL
jgi:hypothetical protein